MRRIGDHGSSSIPIVSLVLKARHFTTDDSAITIDISLHGAKVRTKLTLAPGEMVRAAPKGELPEAILLASFGLTRMSPAIGPLPGLSS